MATATAKCPTKARSVEMTDNGGRVHSVEMTRNGEVFKVRTRLSANEAEAIVKSMNTIPGFSARILSQTE